MSEWQPIETAPKDGSRILTWQPDAASLRPPMMIHHWDGSKWVEDDGRWFVFSPAQWMPLPEPPE